MVFFQVLLGMALRTFPEQEQILDGVDIPLLLQKTVTLPAWNHLQRILKHFRMAVLAQGKKRLHHALFSGPGPDQPISAVFRGSQHVILLPKNGEGAVEIHFVRVRDIRSDEDTPLISHGHGPAQRIVHPLPQTVPFLFEELRPWEQFPERPFVGSAAGMRHEHVRDGIRQGLRKVLQERHVQSGTLLRLQIGHQSRFGSSRFRDSGKNNYCLIHTNPIILFPICCSYLKKDIKSHNVSYYFIINIA